MTELGAATRPGQASIGGRRVAAGAPAKIGAALRLLMACAAIVALAWLGTATAQARSPARPAGGISVDVTPLLATGLGGYAEVVRGDLMQALQAQFAGHLGPRQRLIVQVRGITLNSYVGDRELFFPSNDYLDGVVTLVGANGQELATQKILTVSPASSGGAWYLPGGELRRTAVLSQNFAAWARRYIPG